MTTLSVRVPDELKRIVEARARGQHRQPSDQVRRYLEIAMIAEDVFVNRKVDQVAHRKVTHP